MSTETQSTEREIVAYATKGGKLAKITTAVKTWGELKPLLKAQGYDLNSLLAAENVNRADLVNDLAVLPEGPFKVFLRPKQTKSGADLPYKEVRAKIQALIASDGDAAKAHFNEGKNYTTKKGDELNVLLNSYKGGSKTTTSSAKAEPKKAEPKAKKEAVKTEAPKAESKASPKASEAQEFSEEGCIKVAVEALSKIKSVDTTAIISLVEDLLTTPVKEAEPVKREPTEEELLAEEAKSFLSGY